MALCNSRGFWNLMVTQFLGAFNDNAFKAILFALALERFASPDDNQVFVNITLGALVVFILPFILFSTIAGQLADKFSKRTITIAMRWLELGVLALGTFGLSLNESDASFGFLLAALFLLALQSAIFGPSKYGILPELVTSDDLPKANGIIELSSFVAIIAGTVIFFSLTAAVENKVILGQSLLVLSVIGLFVSFGIGKVPAQDSKRKLTWNPIPELKQTLSVILPARALRRTVVGVAIFWTLAVIVDFSLLFLGRKLLGEEASADAVTQAVGNMRGILGVGIGVGSMLAGFLCDKKPELGLVPLGSLGMGLFILLLSVTTNAWWAYGFLAALGLMGGFFIVPLNVLIQQDAPDADKGRVIAGSNLLTFLVTLVALVVLYLLLGMLQLDVRIIVGSLGVLAIAGTIYSFWLLPDSFFRFLFWLVIRLVYRIRIIGKENLPLKGPALIVANHVSFVDGLLVLASTHRFVRFMVYSGFTRIPGLQWLAKTLKVIPISTEDGPRAIVKSLKEATESLNRGELVCIFAEGQISRTGQLLPFRGGMEKILKGTDAPIIPVHLDRVWGSIFSFKGRKFFWKMPSKVPYPVTISFGEPLANDTPVDEVRQRVQELSSEAFPHRKQDLKPLPYAFARHCRWHPFSLAVADSSGAKLSNAGMMIGSVAIARQMMKVLKSEPMVGLLLPPSVGASLANVAGNLLGKPVVNFNYTVGEEVLQSAAKQCGISKIITSKRFIQKAKVKVPGEAIYLEDLKEEIGSYERLEAMVVAFSPEFVLRRYFRVKSMDMDDVLTVIFSSGSTGEPKGIQLTHFNVLSNVDAAAQGFNFQTDDKLIGILPFFHSTGYTVTLWTPLLTGMAVIYHPNPLDAKTVGKLAGGYKATVLVATPTFLQGYTRRCKPEDFSHLRYAVVGAEKLSDAVRLGFKDKFGIEPLEGYGTTECSPLVSVNVPDFEQEGEKQVGTKQGIGHPLPGVSVKIVHPETMEPLTVGKEGLLLVKGPNIMKGYLGKPELTQEVIQNGWYITGDIARMDSEGFLTLTDRLSRFAKIGGEMVPHLKVEEALNGLLEETEKVLVVTSIPDEKKGERLAVVHVLDETKLKRVIDGLPSSGLPNLFLPRADSFVYTEEIPVLGTGKVDLRGVRQLAVEALG